MSNFTVRIALLILFSFIIRPSSYGQCNCPPNGLNLLTNGGFQDPNTVAAAPMFVGFQSDYSATAPIGNYGIFRWTNDASSILSIWCATPPPNYYLMFDGTTGADAAVSPYDAVRYVNIPVAQGSAYRLIFFSNNQYAPGPFATLTVKVNGVLLDSFVENNTCVWTPHSYCWIADSNLATIAINGGVGTLTGRDFGIDSVFFGIAAPVLNSISATICAGGSFNFNGQILSTPGIYTDTIATPSGCDSIVTLTLAVANAITNTITANFCSGGSYSFNGKTFALPGTYVDTFSSASGCDSIVTLQLSQLAPATGALTANICQGNSYNFGGNVLTVSGIYKDTVKTAGGCDSVITLTLNVGSADTTDIQIVICKDTTIIFAGQNITMPGLYSHTFQTQQGCDSLVRLTVVKIGSPSASFSFTPVTPELNVPTKFINTSSNAKQFLWSFGDGTESIEENPVHLFSNNGTFQVCLTAFADEGCVDKICKKVDAKVLYVANVPSAFSPNGDNNNDVLYVKGAGIKEMSFRVYNRWGTMIFETTDINAGWDGYYKGKPQEMETYAWTLYVTFFDGNKFQSTGNVTLIR